jgi:hypothetical protein
LVISEWTPIVAAMGGVGGLAAILRAHGERASHRSDLMMSLNSTAREWIEYIDVKFDELSAELEVEREARLKRDTARRDLARKHRLWDEQMIVDYQIATGQQVPPPPPFELP